MAKHGKHRPATPNKAALAKQISLGSKLRPDAGGKRLLHLEVAGSKTSINKAFLEPGWSVVTVNPDVKTPADIHANPKSLSMIPDGTFDAVWSNHTLKFFSTNEIPAILSEFKRILKPDGTFYMMAVDMRRIADTIRSRGVEAVIYNASAGPVRAIDILYGFVPLLNSNADKAFVIPKTAFSAKYLGELLKNAGFRDVVIEEGEINLSARAFKRNQDNEKNTKVKITPFDVTKLMAKRDAMEKEPLLPITKKQ